MKNYELLVIGSGPAGEKGAVQAAYFGKKVAVIERHHLVGGACVNTGTIPSKTLRESALYFSGLRQRGLYGIDYSLRENLSVSDFTHRTTVVVETERVKISTNLAQHDVDIFQGQAAFEDAHTLSVFDSAGTTTRLSGDVILIASGSRPVRPPEIPFDDKCVFDSDTILQMKQIPQSLAVVGGGVIGCEYASIFTALGVKVALLDGRERLLTFLDGEISRRLQEHLTNMGLQLLQSERLETMEKTPKGACLRMRSGKTVEMETVLFAAGRSGAAQELKLENAGLSLSNRGYLEVNNHYQTPVPHIYAAGDVIGFPSLASTSMEQGRVAICHAFGFQYKQRLASLLPMGIYTIPEISAVGESEESCQEKKIDYVAGRAQYRNNARGQIIGDASGLLKLIFRRENKKLLGVHIIGENATELIHLGMKAVDEGDTVDSFIDLVFNYPTLSELYKYAAYDGLGNLSGHKLREG